MAQKQITMKNWLQVSSIRIARVRFYFVALFAAWIIASDAWKLVPPEVTLDRWMVLGGVLAVNSVLWYLSRSNSKTEGFYKGLVFAQIAIDILIAAFLVYSQRGIASRGVVLFAVPIIVSAVLLSRSALYATAGISIATYIIAVMRYAILHPGENYRVELYAELAFYSGLFLILAALMNALIHGRRE